MSDTDNPDRKATNLRLPPELHDDLKAFAERTHRSMNGAAIYLLERALREEQGHATGGEPGIHHR